MRARTLVFFLAIFFAAATVAALSAPRVSHATQIELPPPSPYTGLSWVDSATGTETIMKDGGTYTVSFGVSGNTQVGVLDKLYGNVDGYLYSVSATTGTRKFVSYLQGDTPSFLSWSQAGKYELDLYSIEYAFEYGQVVKVRLGRIATAHFTVRDTNNLCAAPGSCADNVLFIPGIEGSRLYYRGALNIEHQVWEPDYYTDIQHLALNADGTSKYALYTKDIVGSIEAHNAFESIIAKKFGQNMQVYGNFEKFMNALVASSTIKAWRAYPYDWRYGVRAVVKNGTLTEQPDGSIKRVYITKVLKKLASTSRSGKVTIIAHSNGGLVAKALVLALGADASKYIDRIILIGTPQWGTPADIGAMLHGDGQTQGLGLVMRGSDVRGVTKTMPDAYDLLPSPAYFAQVASPVATFDTGGSLSKLFAKQFGAAITSFSAFSNFIEDTAGLDAKAGSEGDLHTPAALSSALVEKAVGAHAVLDAWTPPPAIAVTAIAGWGQDTVKTLSYTTKHRTDCSAAFSATAIFSISSAPLCKQVAYLEHTATTTQDGDGTVVSPSAVGDTVNSLYFNSKKFENQHLGKIVHQELTAAAPIQKTIKNLLTGVSPSNESYMTKSEPVGGANPIMLRISTHSPVNVVVTDANGNQSGVLPIPGTDFSGTKRDILGSSVLVFDNEEYVSVPQAGAYSVFVSGYATGTATIRIDTVKDGVASEAETFVGIPTTASSTVTFSLTNGTPTPPVIDMNGNGKDDFTMPTSTSPLAYLRYMRVAIKAMALQKSEYFMLDARLFAIERQLIVENKMHAMESHEMRNRHMYRQHFSNQKNIFVLYELNALSRYVENQFALSARVHKYMYMRRHNSHIHFGLSATATETILGMITQLKSLL